MLVDAKNTECNRQQLFCFIQICHINTIQKPCDKRYQNISNLKSKWGNSWTTILSLTSQQQHHAMALSHPLSLLIPSYTLILTFSMGFIHTLLIIQNLFHHNLLDQEQNILCI